MNKTNSTYIPTFSHEGLTFGCDPLVKWFMREPAIHIHLVEQGRVEKGQRVLDLGCGTAALAVLIKKTHPGADVIGIDGDRNILDVAKAKTRKQDVSIPLFDSRVFDLPCSDSYFDRVFASMLFYHLAMKEKILAAKEIYRILKPGGELHVADFGMPRNALMACIARITRHFEEVDDNVQGLLPHVVFAADFKQIETTMELMTILGTISLLKAKKPR
ncbi:MAG: class I SAM-dependent methyltransferase [Nitrospirota bacterium]